MFTHIHLVRCLYSSVLFRKQLTLINRLFSLRFSGKIFRAFVGTYMIIGSNCFWFKQIEVIRWFKSLFSILEFCHTGFYWRWNESKKSSRRNIKKLMVETVQRVQKMENYFCVAEYDNMHILHKKTTFFYYNIHFSDFSSFQKHFRIDFIFPSLFSKSQWKPL